MALYKDFALMAVSMKRDKYASIKQACFINDQIFKEIITHFSFRTERDVAHYIRKRFRDFHVKPAYPPIVANNHMIIHPKPRKKKLERGWLLLDFGCKYNTWCSDMTRTIYLGKATSKEKKLYALVLQSQVKTARQIKRGILGCDLDIHARHLLGDYKPFLKHAVGHGVSTKIHDLPRISVTSSDRVKRGDVITIEPGIYFKTKDKAVGIRIEDSIFVGKRVEILTRSPKHLIEIPFP